MPGIWTSLTSYHRSISWPIDWVFRIPLVSAWCPELTALLTAFPRAAMLVLIMGRAQAEAFVLHLAAPAPSKRKKCRITTNPLITTRRFDQRRLGIATEATLLADDRFGFHAVGGHGLSRFVDRGLSSLALTRQVRPSANRSLLSDQVHRSPPPPSPNGQSPSGLARARRP